MASPVQAHSKGRQLRRSVGPSRYPAVLFSILLVLTATASSTRAGGDVPAEWVAIRTAGDHGLRRLDGEPSLADLGYAVVPVPAGRDRDEYLEELRATGLVTLAEPDRKVIAADTAPSDSLYADFQAPYLVPVGAESAWDLATGDGRVVVAVLDTGIDLGHPEFQGRLWTNPAEVAGNGIDDDGNGCADDVHGCRFLNLTPERADSCGYTSSEHTGAVQDDHGTFAATHHSHGTLVSGILGAAGDNAQGVAGIGWDVRLMVVKVLDCGVPSQGGRAAGDLTNVAQGIDYARRMGADIINVSLATTDGVTDLSMLRDAVRSAQDDGVIVVAAAGNHNPGDANVSPGYPAAYSGLAGYPLVVAVGASDNTNGNEWASYSNYGQAIDFAAPGNQIASTTRSDLPPATGYGIASRGTSYATPIVSGMLALMKSRNSGLAPSEYLDIARAAATPAAPAPHGQNWAGAGIVDLGRALAMVPMAVSGVALHDWVDVDEGTTVVALVGGTECGRTVTMSPLVGTFALTVRSAAETPGCGEPGASVGFTLDGLLATTGLDWGGRNVDLSVAGLEITTVSPPPGPIVVQDLSAGWNNIAHLGATGSPPAAFSYLPEAWTELGHWRAAAGGVGAPGAFEFYSRTAPSYANDIEQVPSLSALWVNLSGPAVVAAANPHPALGRAIGLRAGWNNFVYTGTSRAVADALSDVDGLYELVVRFDNATGTWEVYSPELPRFLNDFGGLMRLQVYWIYMTRSGVLTMR